MFESGIIILDKPCGHVAHEVTSFVKKLTKSSKSGHAGTLDPDVSGVMPIALGKDTKMLRFLSSKDKTYVGIIKFKEEVSTDVVKDIFTKFEGDIIQMPPKKSAVKKRKRMRHVFYLKFLEKKGKLVLFETKVSAGTYIRVLCVDIGKKLGIPARMEELRRVSVGLIKEDISVSIQELIDAVWLYREKDDDSLIRSIVKPITEFINYNKIIIKERASSSLRNGAQLMAPGIVEVDDGIKNGDLISLFSLDGSFVGIGSAIFSTSEMGVMKKGQVVKTERIY